MEQREAKEQRRKSARLSYVLYKDEDIVLFGRSWHSARTTHAKLALAQT